MHLLAINGSPRINSNTGILIDSAIKPFIENNWTIKKININQITVAPCDGCDFCQEKSQCKINDGMTEIYNEFQKCNAIIIGSPVYYRNVTAQLKAVFDRTYAHNNIRSLEGKFGGAIAVGRGEGGGQGIVFIIISYLAELFACQVN